MTFIPVENFNQFFLIWFFRSHRQGATIFRLYFRKEIQHVKTTAFRTVTRSRYAFRYHYLRVSAQQQIFTIVTSAYDSAFNARQQCRHNLNVTVKTNVSTTKTMTSTWQTIYRIHHFIPDFRYHRRDIENFQLNTRRFLRSWLRQLFFFLSDFVFPVVSPMRKRLFLVPSAYRPNN